MNSIEGESRFHYATQWLRKQMFCMKAHITLSKWRANTPGYINENQSLIAINTINNNHYYSFKIFPRFWLVKTTHIIHRKQLLLTENSVILNQWRQKCSPLQIIEPLMSKWCQKCSPLQIIESLTSKIIEPLAEKTWAQGCVIISTKREMASSRVYKFERRKYFEWTIKQLLKKLFGFQRIWRILRILEGVIDLRLRPRWITLSSTCRILHILLCLIQ